MNRAGLRVSSRGVSISITEPFGIQSAVHVQMGKGKASFDDVVCRKPRPMGHQPLVRQSWRWWYFSAARSMPGDTGTLGSGHISSRYVLSNSTVIDEVPVPSWWLTSFDIWKPARSSADRSGASGETIIQIWSSSIPGPDAAGATVASATETRTPSKRALLIDSSL